MLRHPIQPMVVHFPVACWLLTTASNAAALALDRPFFWHVAAIDLGRIKGRPDVQRIAIVRASL